MKALKRLFNIYYVGTDAIILLFTTCTFFLITILCLTIPNLGATVETAFLWLVSYVGSLGISTYIAIYIIFTWILIRTAYRTNPFFVVYPMLTKRNSYLLTQSLSLNHRNYDTDCFVKELSSGIKDSLQTLKPGTYYAVTHDKMIQRFKRFCPDNMEIIIDGEAGKSSLVLEKFFMKSRCKRCPKTCPAKQDIKEPVSMKYIRIIVS